MKDFESAWSALSGSTQENGWLSTHLASSGSCAIRAGRRMPQDLEAMLLGFQGACFPKAAQLPAGKGFLVEIVRDPALPSLGWIALSRQEGASLELFNAMVQDLFTFMTDLPHHDGGQQQLQLLLGRVHSWQEFMRRSPGGILTLEEEIGLHGELCVLDRLLDETEDGVLVVESWQGPLGGLHDFALPSSAVEVKSTVSPAGFRAVIDSLDQLDPATRSPLYLAAVRLTPDAEGVALPQRLTLLHERLSRNWPQSLESYNARILQAGYLAAMAARYSRRFRLKDMRLLEVDKDFPAMTLRSVPRGVLSARYVIDLDIDELRQTSWLEAINGAVSRP